MSDDALNDFCDWLESQAAHTVMYRFDVDYLDEERGIKHIPCADGDYVLAEDALALQAKIDELTELVASLEEVRTKEYAFKQAKIEELTAIIEMAESNFDIIIMPLKQENE